MSASDRLTQAEYDKYRDQVLKDGLKGESREKPVAVIIAGQPGCGKSGVRNAAVDRFKENGGCTVVDVDEVRASHPRYPAWMKENDKTAADRSHEDASKAAGELRDAAIAQKKNLVIDGTLKNPEKAKATAETLKAEGYRVEAVGLCVKPEESWKGVGDRYQKERDKFGQGRWVPKSTHDQAVEGVPKSLAGLEQGRVDSLEVRTRENKLLHKSEPSKTASAEERKRNADSVKNVYVEHGGRTREQVGLTKDPPPREGPGSEPRKGPPDRGGR